MDIVTLMQAKAYSKLLADFVQYGKYSEVYLSHQIGVYCRIGFKPYAGVVNQYNRCASLKVTAGETLKVSMKVTAYFEGYVFLDSTGEIVSYRPTATGTMTITDEEVVVPANAVTMYVNSGVDYAPVVKRNKPIYGYDSLMDETPNLISSLSQFGSATISGETATVTAANGGFISNIFKSSSNSMSINVVGNFTVPTLAIQIQVNKKAGGVSYLQLKTVTGGAVNTTVTFDPAYQAVYNDADSFNVVINSVNSSTSGTITISTAKTTDNSEFQQSEYYDTSFKKMMTNVFNALNTVQSSTLSSGSASELFQRDENGKNYKIQVTSTGLKAIPCIPRKTLFMGNSLLLGFTTYGMCASDNTKDYYAYVTSKILEKNPSATFDKLHDAAFEQAESDATADSYFTTNTAKFASDLDLVIIQIGDNVNNTARKSTFAKNFPLLIGKIRTACPNARIIIVGIWFNSPEVYTTLTTTCSTYSCEMVDIRALCTTENQGVSGQTYVNQSGQTVTVDDAYITHPGDVGFPKIGDEIVTTMKM